ncbi:hypothetical protein AB4275_10145 [Vibrio cyclitrophicus]
MNEYYSAMNCLSCQSTFTVLREVRLEADLVMILQSHIKWTVGYDTESKLSGYESLIKKKALVQITYFWVFV